MSTLITIVISGMAVGYVVEFLTSALDRWLSSSTIKLIFTIPFSLLFNWLLGLLDITLLAATFASGFFALVVMALVNRPVVLNNSLNRR